MNLDDLMKQTGQWLKGTGPDSDIVLSSRIRLARNMANIPFSHWAEKKEKEKVLELTKPVILGMPYMKDCLFLKIGELDNLDKQFLLERHLVSREHITTADSKAVAISGNEVISIMINEEDHLRIQVIESGLNLVDVWTLINKIDTELSEYLEFAFSPEWGYLTACPTNTGTGIRASAMLHLPALTITKQINKVLHAIIKVGMAARGFYGEGTEAAGNFFQISNQVTLGHKEEELIGNLEKIIRQVMEHESNARAALLSQQKDALNDRIWRSLGMLKSAYIMTSQEAMEHLSGVRLGVDTGLIKDITRSQLNDLFLTIQPAHLQKLEGKTLTAAQRDARRAALIREKLE